MFPIHPSLGFSPLNARERMKTQEAVEDKQVSLHPNPNPN